MTDLKKELEKLAAANDELSRIADRVTQALKSIYQMADQALNPEAVAELQAAAPPEREWLAGAVFVGSFLVFATIQAAVQNRSSSRVQPEPEIVIRRFPIRVRREIGS